LWIEGLRTDSLCTDLIGGGCDDSLRVAQLASIVLLLIGVVGLWWNHQRPMTIDDLPAPAEVKTLYDDEPAVPTIPIAATDLHRVNKTSELSLPEEENPTRDSPK
jgi:nitrogen fixation-related uncharacterized protein